MEPSNNNNATGSIGGSGGVMPKLKAVPVQPAAIKSKAKAGQNQVFEMNVKSIEQPQNKAHNVNMKVLKHQQQVSNTLVVCDSPTLGFNKVQQLSNPLHQTIELARHNLDGLPHKPPLKAPYPQLLTSIHSSQRRESDAGGGDNNEFNLFTHHKLSQSERGRMENYATLKEAILELYLSVKIRSDDEIDNYTEEQFKIEKKEMRAVDGFTLIDLIKSSIEALMNMKVEEGGAQRQEIEFEEEEEEEAAEKYRRRMERREAKKKKKQEQKADEGETGNAKPRPIPKIDGNTPTSSILDLQQRLDQISSPRSHLSLSDSSASSNQSIPFAHKEYERALRQLEQECRNHIKVEQQMKLHIEVLQEKMENEKLSAKQQLDKLREESQSEQEQMKQLVKKLEEESKSKQEKIKSYEGQIRKLQEEGIRMEEKVKVLQEQVDKFMAMRGTFEGPPEIMPDYSDFSGGNPEVGRSASTKKGSVMLRSSHQLSQNELNGPAAANYHLIAQNAGKALNSHRALVDRSKLQVLDPMGGPTPPGIHHNRMLSDGIALITSGNFTDRSNGMRQAQSQYAESYNRLGKFVNNSAGDQNQSHLVAKSLGSFPSSNGTHSGKGDHMMFQQIPNQMFPGHQISSSANFDRGALHNVSRNYAENEQQSQPIVRKGTRSNHKRSKSQVNMSDARKSVNVMGGRQQAQQSTNSLNSNQQQQMMNHLQQNVHEYAGQQQLQTNMSFFKNTSGFSRVGIKHQQQTMQDMSLQGLNTSRTEHEANNGRISARRNIAQQQQSTLPFTGGPGSQSTTILHPQPPGLMGIPSGGGHHLRHNTEIQFMGQSIQQQQNDLRNSVEYQKKRVGSISSIQQLSSNGGTVSGRGSAYNAQNTGSNSRQANHFQGKELTQEQHLSKIYLDNSKSQLPYNAKGVPKAYLQKVLAENHNRAKSNKINTAEGTIGQGVINSSFTHGKR